MNAVLETAWPLYSLALFFLSLFGAHRLLLVVEYLLRRQNTPWRPSDAASMSRPFVTVQLPMFNEANVAERVIRSAAALRYPRAQFEIQVLDDSTDETCAIIDNVARDLRASGTSVSVIRRRDRAGYKAGALEHGLREAQGELLFILDADFVVPEDFLEKVVGHFLDPCVAVVQARWGHLNRERSALTRAQAQLLDGHFVLEHHVRALSGMFFNFNGSGGIWRRAALDDSGGWQSDTLTEDLDLSYRAQLRGWKIVYRPDIVVFGELPERVAAFRSQQYRWAKGGIQTAKKLLFDALCARISVRAKAEAVIHLLSNSAYPLVLFVGLVAPLFVLFSSPTDPKRQLVSWMGAGALAFGTGAHGIFYFVTARLAGRKSWIRVTYDTLLAFALGIGLSLSQTKAVLSALSGRRSAFERTPKDGPAGPTRHTYGTSISAVIASLEWAVFLWLGLATVHATATHTVGVIPLFFVYMSGFFWLATAPWTEKRNTCSVNEHARTIKLFET